tara:strand:- start:624 stop:1358 length:735 start_codon:yes stop_codon:yes gene_type:complete
MNIIIIGATGGIGNCLSHDLSTSHNLYIGSKNQEKVDTLINDINVKSNHNVSGSKLEASDFESIKEFLLNANNYLGSIDCIINCVGSLLLKPAHTTSEEELENIFKTNVFSCFGILKHSFKFLRNNGGSLIFFSSAASKVGLKNHEAIASAKAAVSSMVLSAASTYAKYNIRVNAIAPGLVETPLTESIVSNKMSLDYSKNLHGLGRIGKPENFIPIINSLVDKRSDWITGQTIFVDGGLSNVK